MRAITPELIDIFGEGRGLPLRDGARQTVERDLRHWEQMPPDTTGRDEVIARLEGMAQLLRQVEPAFADLRAGPQGPSVLRRFPHPAV